MARKRRLPCTPACSRAAPASSRAACAADSLRGDRPRIEALCGEYSVSMAVLSDMSSARTTSHTMPWDGHVGSIRPFMVVLSEMSSARTASHAASQTSVAVAALAESYEPGGQAAPRLTRRHPNYSGLLWQGVVYDNQPHSLPRCFGTNRRPSTAPFRTTERDRRGLTRMTGWTVLSRAYGLRKGPISL